ncbi:hypothetical protein Hanom_Chr08g00700561 [Helianthus anomalus]
MTPIEVAGDNIPSFTSAMPWRYANLILRLIVAPCVPVTNLRFIIVNPNIKETT